MAKKKKKAQAEAPKIRPLALVIPAKTGVQGDRTKLGWQQGEERSNQKVDGDGDGQSIDDWLAANAAKANTTTDQWLKGAVDNIRDKGGWMSDVPDLKTSDDVKGLLDGLYARDSDAYNNKIWPMWKAAGAKHDSPWQYKTSLREYLGKTKQEKVWDPSLKSWVTVESPEMKYVDASTVPYLVRNDAPVGSIFKASYKDAKGAMHEAYLVVADHGTNKAEMSPAALSALGIKGSANDVPDMGVKLQYLGQGDTSKLPTAESVKKDGERLEGEWKKKQEEEAAKKKAKKQPGKRADAQKQGGAFFLAEVPDHRVVAGENQLLVAVENAACKHNGGQPVCTGSQGILVGVDQSPLAGEGDKTQDQLVIRKGTGDQTILMA